MFQLEFLLLKLFTTISKQYMLPLASNTEGVEARIKDVSLRKTTGKSESNVTKIRTLRFVVLKYMTKIT